MSVFGVQCDAISQSGKRCRCKNQWEIPCTAVYDARFNSYRSDTFRPVRLCEGHAGQMFNNARIGKRLKLHHGGWLGPYNNFGYGNLVITKPTIDWSKFVTLKIPKYWAQKEAAR